MTTSAWIFLTVSWTMVTFAAGWCLYRVVVRKPDDGPRPKGSA